MPPPDSAIPAAYKGNEPFIFISYKHAGDNNPELKKFQNQVYEEISRLQKIGYNIWYDEGNIPGQYSPVISDKINDCCFLIAFIVPEYMESSFCKNEIILAGDKNKNYISVFLKHVNIDSEEKIGKYINNKKHINKFELSDSEYYKQLNSLLPSISFSSKNRNNLKPYSGNEKLIYISNYPEKDNLFKIINSSINFLQSHNYNVFFRIDTSEPVNENKISRCFLFIVFLSKTSVYYDRLINEVEIVKKYEKQNKIKILPIYIEKTELKKGLDYLLLDYAYINQYNISDFKYFQKLLSEIPSQGIIAGIKNSFVYFKNSIRKAFINKNNRILALAILILIFAIGAFFAIPYIEYENFLKSRSKIAPDKENNISSKDIESAIALNAQFKYKEALVKLKRIIEQNPKLIDVNYNIGIAYENIGSKTDALIYFERELKNNPQNKDAANRAKNIKSMIEFNKSYAKASKYINLADYTRAEIELKKAVSFNKASQEAYYALASVYEKLNKPEAAYKAYKTAFSINHNYLDVAEKIKKFENNEGHTKEVEPKIIENKEAEQDKLFYEYCEKAESLKKSSKLSAAIMEFEKALKIKPDSPDIHFNIAELYKSISQSNKAIDAYKTAINLKSDYIIAYKNLAALYKENGDISSAIAIYEKIVNIKPDGNESLLIEIGDYYMKTSNIQKAIASYKEMLNKSPDSAAAKNSLYNAYYKSGASDYEAKKFEQSMANFSEASKYKPDCEKTFYYQGCIYYNAYKDYDIAMQKFERAASLKPNYIEAFYMIGCVAMSAKNYQLAKKYFQKVFEINQDYYDTRKQLSQIDSILNSSNSPENSEVSTAQTADTPSGRDKDIEKLTSKASLYFENKQYEMAAIEFEKALRLNTSDTDIEYHMYICQGLSNIVRGDYNAAISKLKNALSINSSDPALIEILADCHYKNYQHEIAINLYKEALKRGPANYKTIEQKIRDVENDYSPKNTTQNYSRNNEDEDLKREVKKIEKVIINKILDGTIATHNWINLYLPISNYLIMLNQIINHLRFYWLFIKKLMI